MVQANMSMLTSPSPSLTVPSKANNMPPQYQISVNKASPNIIEYRPKEPSTSSTKLQPFINSSSASIVPVSSVIPLNTSTVSTFPVVYQSNGPRDSISTVSEHQNLLSSSLVGNIIDNILAESEPDAKIMDALSLGIPSNL